MAVVQLDPSSEEYQRFARLYQAARELRPSEVDRWNGELYATVGDDGAWGSFANAGHFKLSKELVLDKLGPAATPQEQVQALATVLHESNHARVEINAQHEPNAVLARESKALDEGLTEWVSVNDVAAFADATGYGELPDAKPEYPAAHQATEELLEYAAGPDGVDRLAGKALDAPVVMRWDVIADEIVQNRLGDVVPQDPEHQQAARAELINTMTKSGWGGLEQAPGASLGSAVAHETTTALDGAVTRLREHYAQNPGQPFPAKTPNFLIAQNEAQAGLDDGGTQQRAVGQQEQVDLSKLPPPDASTRVDAGQATEAQQPTEAEQATGTSQTIRRTARGRA